MDQQELRDLEYRCIQEEAPWCAAACPLHVNGRALTAHVAAGRWTDAWKVLQKHMPLPGILGRICDAPCQARCKRGEAGEAIRIGALERACVQTETPAQTVRPLPSKGKTVAIAGAGLGGLTAAWDLARKGYAVTVFEEGNLPGDVLRRRHSLLLPADVIDAEIARLTQIGVSVEPVADLKEEAFAARCVEAFDAVYLDIDAIGLDAVKDRQWMGDGDDDHILQIEDATGLTGQAKVFAIAPTLSPVMQAAGGRRAAVTMDRFLQSVSLTAGRDREGPFDTRLHTSLAGVAPLSAVAMADPAKGYSQGEAMAEAQRCLQCQCLECVKVCAYLETYGAYPKKYARQIYNNLSIVLGEHPANKMINSCSLCGLCQQVCPNDFPMQDLCLTARRAMVEKDKMPPSAHEFALMDMAFSQSERFSLARHQPGCRASAQVFFPGCQLCASAPGQVEAVYGHLWRSLPDGVGLMLGCCGAPAHWAGQTDAFAEQAGHLEAQWDELGQPRMILACATCLQMFKTHLPMVPVAALWTVLEAHPPALRAPLSAGPLAVHDPCTTRHEGSVQADVRHLLQRCGAAIEELNLGGIETECCGFGGLMQMANPDLARDVVRQRAGRSPSDYVTYCAMCRDNLAATGKRVIHLLDLYFPVDGYPDPALRPRPGWSQRQENRARLKAHLLKRLWNEAPDTMSEEEKRYQAIHLEIASETAEMLDRRRILVEDLQLVIHHAETSGDRLFHPPSGHYKAAYAPYKVTFWVEYSVLENGFRVHNAYAHRMEVLGP